jgi:4'-phosphopantetheinyl transferase
MIKVYYTKFEGPLDEGLWDHYSLILPPECRKRNQAFRRWQDKHAHLFGRLLLHIGLKEFGYKNNPLFLLQYDAYSRPFVDGDIDFNISHSGSWVICAIARHAKLGVDIEEYKPVEFNYYEDTMDAGQWQCIHNSPVPEQAFFNYWTIKESVVKADGRGLSIPMKSIKCDDHSAYVDGKVWHLTILPLDKQYSSSLACNIQETNILIKEIDFYIPSSLSEQQMSYQF